MKTVKSYKLFEELNPNNQFYAHYQSLLVSKNDETNTENGTCLQNTLYCNEETCSYFMLPMVWTV